MTIPAPGAVHFGAIFAVSGKPSVVDEVTDGLRRQADSQGVALRSHVLPDAGGDATMVFATGDADTLAFDQSVGAYEAFQQMAAMLSDPRKNPYKDNGLVARTARTQMDSLMHSFLSRAGTPKVETLFPTFARIVSEYQQNFHAHVADLLPDRVRQAYDAFLQKVPTPLGARSVSIQLAQGSFDLQNP